MGMFEIKAGDTVTVSPDACDVDALGTLTATVTEVFPVGNIQVNITDDFDLDEWDHILTPATDTSGDGPDNEFLLFKADIAKHVRIGG